MNTFKGGEGYHYLDYQHSYIKHITWKNHFPNGTLLILGSLLPLFIQKPTTVSEITSFKTDTYKNWIVAILGSNIFYKKNKYDIYKALSTLRKVSRHVTKAKGFRRPSLDWLRDPLERNWRHKALPLFNCDTDSLFGYINSIAIAITTNFKWKKFKREGRKWK